MSNEAKHVPIYPCIRCGKLRSEAEGGTTFTVCDACWDSHGATDEADVERLTKERDEARARWSESDSALDKLREEFEQMMRQRDELREFVDEVRTVARSLADPAAPFHKAAKLILGSDGTDAEISLLGTRLVLGNMARRACEALGEHETERKTETKQ